MPCGTVLVIDAPVSIRSLPVGPAMDTPCAGGRCGIVAFTRAWVPLYLAILAVMAALIFVTKVMRLLRDLRM